MAAETPCSVLYNDIRSFGGLKHLEIARMLINGNSYLGSTLLEKCSSNRSYLTRYIVHRKPDQCAPAIYSDFTVTTLHLSAAICSKLGGGESAYRAIAEHYRGPAANEMMSALASYKLDSRLYANALNRIDNFDGNAVREKSTLYLMLFVATGALADPVQGVATVERFCDSKTGGHFGTTETTVGRGFMGSLDQPHAVAPNLGLLRTHADNCVDMQIHPLTRDPRGTVIGSLPKTSPSITDVGADASREHLRIWLEGEHWYAQGLGSTNGTVLESGAGDGDIVIEPPRDLREPGKIYPPWKSPTATGSIWVSTRHSLSLWTSTDGDRKTVAVRLSSSTFCVVNDNTQRYTWAVRLSWYFTDIRTAHVYARQPMPDKGTPWILPIAPMATNSSVLTRSTPPWRSTPAPRTTPSVGL